MKTKGYPWRMPRFFCGVLLLALLFCGQGHTVWAMQEGVYDDAGLLKEHEIASLADVISSVEEETGWHIFAVTTDDAEGKTAEAYADDFFDSHSPEQEDGVAVLIDMDHREIWMSTCGEAIRYLTDERIDRILDDAYADISGGEYGACLYTMVEGVRRAYADGIPGGQYNYDRDTGEVSVYRRITMMEALVAAAVAAAAGLIVFFSIVGKYRIKFNPYRYNPRESGRMTLRVKDDQFINSHTSHRRIQTSSSTSHSSSGRSTTHRSSSGRSHGGGGRRF